MQRFEFLRQPLLGELAMSRKKERKREKKNAIYSGHLRLCQQSRAVHALRSDQKVNWQSTEKHSTVRKNWSYCGQCDNRFEELSELKEHEKTHNEKTKFRCNKFEREYPEMSQLRRHDWRNHREVSCNICEEMLQSRQDISNHRRIKHQILKKVLCRFYPSCLDGYECFFVHEQSNENMNTSDGPSPFFSGGKNWGLGTVPENLSWW